MNIKFSLQTDPANLDYQIVSGARRQEKRFKAEDNGTVVPDEKVIIKMGNFLGSWEGLKTIEQYRTSNYYLIKFQSSIAKLATDSMFKLKHEGLDKRKGKDAAPTIAKIVEIQGHKYIILNFL